jgi:hypothetical protein
VTLTYSYRCKECGHLFDLIVGSWEEFMATQPKCSCGSTRVHRYVPVGHIPVLTEGKARMDAKYPYVSHTLPRGGKMKGCRHTELGKPIIESKQHERNIMAGAGNGERYTRE